MFTPFGQRWLPALGRWLHCIGGTVFTPFDFRQVAALYSDHYRGGVGLPCMYAHSASILMKYSVILYSTAAHGCNNILIPHTQRCKNKLLTDNSNQFWSVVY